MVYCLIFLVISFIASFPINFILRKLQLRKKKKKIIRLLKVFRLASATSVLTIIIALIVGQIITEAHNNDYTIPIAEQSECYHAQIDPASFPKKTIEKGTLLSENEVESNTSEILQSDEALQSNEISQPDKVPQFNGISQPDEVPQSNETSQPGIGNKIPYDFSILMIFGEYQFGEYITTKDLVDMRIMYDEYWKNEMYEDMLKQDNKTGDISVLLENIGLLKQSAIEAENAIDNDNIKTIDGYTPFFGHIRESVLKFSYVIGNNDTQDSDNKKEDIDIKYCMGKILYRPATDLAYITNSERYYSLCSAYVVLKDAFDHSSLDNTYAIDVAYSYLLVCNDIVNVMEPGQSYGMINRVKLAYYQLLERVDETSVNLKYQSYCEEAKQIMKRLEEYNIEK